MKAVHQRGVIVQVKHHEYDGVGVWVQRHLHLCDHISGWSKDPSSQFGCVITDTLYRPIGYGVNGFARGFKDTPERWNDRPFKYRHVIHAEENALLNSVTKCDGSIAFVNGCPCSSCMSKLAQAQVANVWCWEPNEDYLSRWSIDEPLQVAIECSMVVNFVKRQQ